MKKFFRYLFGIILLILAAYFLYLAYQEWTVYKEANDEYADLMQYVEEQENGTFYIDWDALMAINDDIVGWIVMDSGANYPIMQAEDNSYYLHRGFTKEYSVNGSIFMNCGNSSDFSDENTIIYGHNMNNGSMFGSNKKYMRQSYAAEHPYFYIFVPDGMYTYEIFDTITTTEGTAPFEYYFSDTLDFENFLTNTSAMANYNMGVSVSSTDRIVSLITCASYGTKRFIIRGRLSSLTNYDGIVEEVW